MTSQASLKLGIAMGSSISFNRLGLDSNFATYQLV